LKRSSTFYYLC